MSFFEYIILSIKNNLIFHYKLTDNFFLIIPINLRYLKFELKNMLQFSKFILKTHSMHWMRVSFRGKGYRLRKFKKHNKVTLNFGHSHWSKLVLVNNLFFFKKIRRQNYLCLTKTYYNYKSLKLSLKFFKKLNSYTKRGLRLKKQYICRRFGKISQVVSSLH